MDKDIGIATTTRYGSLGDVRCKLALRMVEEAVEIHGFSVLVVDGSPNPDEIRRALREVGACVIPEQQASTMGIGRRYALGLSAARGYKVNVWMEPEKVPLLPFIRRISQPILDGRAHITVPSRDEAGFLSYPRVQMLAEQLGNETFENVSGLKLDMWQGSRFIGEKAVRFFTEYDGKYGDQWDSIFIPVLRAYAAGLQVMDVPMEYIHPREQAEEDERNKNVGILKRLAQINNLIPALYQEAQLLGLCT